MKPLLAAATAASIVLGATSQLGGGQGAQLQDADLTNRIVIFILGIDSQGYLSCDPQNAPLVHRFDNLKEALAGILPEENILWASYKNGDAAYCDSSYQMPIYAALDTCDGAVEAAEELDRLVRKFDGATFDIVGHSLGGIVAAYWAAGGTAGDDFATDDPGFLDDLHSVSTLDSPLNGVPEQFPLSACDFSTDSWQDMLALTPVIPRILGVDSDGANLLTSKVNVAHLNSTAIGDLLPGHWRNGPRPCGLGGIDPGVAHACMLDQAGRLGTVAMHIATDVYDDRNSNFKITSGEEWETEYSGGSTNGWIRGSARKTDDDTAASIRMTDVVGSALRVLYTGAASAEVRVDGGPPQLMPDQSTCDRYPFGHNGTLTRPPLCQKLLFVAPGSHTVDITTVPECPLFNCAYFFFDAIEVGPIVSKLDLAFVIDVTGSMADDIMAVKEGAADMVNVIHSVVLDARIALVTYRDFPTSPYGDPGDFPFRDNLDFTADKIQVLDAIQTLSVGGGADGPESVYCALMHTIQADRCDGRGIGDGVNWRDIPSKFIILMGDAPPHDPEPFTGFVAADIVTAAINADPITVEAISIGGSISQFEAIAEGTGGHVFEASDASSVPGAIIDAIEEAVTPADTASPTTVAIVDPPPSASGWHATDVSVELSAADDLSGVSELHYQIDVEPETVVAGDVASILLTSEGLHTVSFWAVDAAGNVEGVQTLAVKIDKTAPLSSLDQLQSRFSRIPVPLEFEAADALSGVQRVELWFRHRRAFAGPIEPWTRYNGDFSASPIDFVPPSGMGFLEIYTLAVDRAGNLEAPPTRADILLACRSRAGFGVCLRLPPSWIALLP